MLHCQSGRITGHPCGEKAAAVVEVMPCHLRASHAAAGNAGWYPHNGADRYRMCRECAQDIVAYDDWAHIVE